MKASPLQGKVICITRSFEQAKKTAELVKKRGAIPFLFPVVKQVPVEENFGFVEDKLRENGYDYIVFTSANAIRFFAQLLEKRGFQIQDLKAKIACVGPQTASQAEILGLEVFLVPDDFLGVSLVDALKKTIPSSAKILYPRPEKVSHDLKEDLEKEGFFVDEVIIYKTIPDDSFVDEAIRAFSEERVDVVTFTSGSTVKFFLKLLEGRLDLESLLEKITVAVIGPSTKKAAEKLGLRVDVVPDNYTFVGILDALEKYFSSV